MLEYPVILLSIKSMIRILVQERTVTNFNLRDNQQETLLIKGSSETTCKETLFIFNKIFLDWFIGFTEGDGSFVIPNERLPQFEITQNIRDIDLLYKIKKILGFGSVVKRLTDDRNVGVFQVIGNKKHLFILALIFNGNLRSKQKEIQFNKWYILLEKELSNKYIFPKYISIIKDVSLKDSWLSGFSDAEGCFQARLKECKTSRLRKQLVLSFSLAQKTYDVLLNIKNCLQLVNEVTFDKSWKGYRIFTQNFKKQKILMDYFKLFPLKTKKKIEFLRWYNLYNDKLNKLHLSENGLKIIEKKVKKFKV